MCSSCLHRKHGGCSDSARTPIRAQSHAQASCRSTKCLDAQRTRRLPFVRVPIPDCRCRTDLTASSGQDTLSRISQMQFPGTSAGDEPFILPTEEWEPPAQTHEGLQVFTLGLLLPRSSVEDTNGNWTFPGEDGAVGSGSASTTDGRDTVGGGIGVEDEGYEEEESPDQRKSSSPRPRTPLVDLPRHRPLRSLHHHLQVRAATGSYACAGRRSFLVGRYRRACCS